MLHTRIYNEDGIFERNFSLKETLFDRRQIDDAMDNDKTFGYLKLKNVIMALDPTLLENFYSMNYGEAMRKVHDEIKKQRNSYLSEQRKNKILSLREMLKIANEENFEPEQTLEIKDKLHDEMMRDQDNNLEVFTDLQYVKMVTDAAFKIEDERQNKDEQQRSYSSVQEEE